MVKPSFLRSLVAKPKPKGKIHFYFTTESKVEKQLIESACTGLLVHKFDAKDITVMDVLSFIENEYTIKYENPGSILVSWEAW